MREIVTTDNTITVTEAGAAVWEAYAAELDASEKTKATYTRALRQFAAWLEDAGLTPLQAKRETVLAYRADLAAAKSASTVNLYLAAVRSFYRWLESRRVYPNVAAGVRGLKTSAKQGKDALTRDQAAELVKPRGDDLASLRDAAMLTLMCRRGLRTIEISRANIGDVRQVGGKAVLYVQGKGYADKGEFVVLEASCLKPLYAYLEARGEKDPAAPLFASLSHRNAGGRMTTRSISRVAKQSMKEIGIAGARLTAHSLRHTAVTAALAGGATVQEAQAMARHSNINTTMIYAHNLTRTEARAERAADAWFDGFEAPRAA
ncbi:tyrosine-type recombinase/integrase [Paratractidigestivibacter sp.]|uniref:tyrosine-type recombinase/integrase n=1 Tax=Paratractidigestivibacter sp. TaxID=2847316 RepID=UPI002ABD71BD|nr:tyrosine-type recombinase/integrase [Paratractidigestivibacter sp.]